MIYHMLPAALWQQTAGEWYAGDTLATEGFIHCTGEPVLLLQVANRYYQTQPSEFVILCIEPSQVRANIQWEAADEAYFPHIYGPLNVDAVTRVVQFPRGTDGTFLLPLELAAEK